MLKDFVKTLSGNANPEHKSLSWDIVIVFFLSSTPYGKMFISYILN